MGNATKAKEDARINCIAVDEREESETLRRELARYRGLFDAARLIVGHEFARPLTGGVLAVLLLLLTTMLRLDLGHRLLAATRAQPKGTERPEQMV